MAVSILEVIQNRLPFLDLSIAAVELKVQRVVKEVQYTLQIHLDKTDLEVEDELSYSAQERILIGVYAAFLLLKNKAISTLAGDVETGEAASSKTLKKAKADAVEAEFQVIKASDGSTIAINTKELLGELKSEICQTARLLAIRLPICGDCDIDLPVPMRVIKWTC